MCSARLLWAWCTAAPVKQQPTVLRSLPHTPKDGRQHKLESQTRISNSTNKMALALGAMPGCSSCGSWTASASRCETLAHLDAHIVTPDLAAAQRLLHSCSLQLQRLCHPGGRHLPLLGRVSLLLWLLRPPLHSLLALAGCLPVSGGSITLHLGGI